MIRKPGKFFSARFLMILLKKGKTNKERRFFILHWRARAGFMAVIPGKRLAKSRRNGRPHEDGALLAACRNRTALPAPGAFRTAPGRFVFWGRRGNRRGRPFLCFRPPGRSRWNFVDKGVEKLVY